MKVILRAIVFGAFAALLVAGQSNQSTALADQTVSVVDVVPLVDTSPTPDPPPIVIDCRGADGELCAECGGNQPGFICCLSGDCTIIKAPPIPTPSPAPRK